MTQNTLIDTEAGSPTGEPASGVCTKCKAPRDRKNSRYCKGCRNAMAADYRARMRPRPTYEERSCSLDGCDATFIWCSMNPKQLYCSKSHYMKARYQQSRPVPEALPRGTIRCSRCKSVKMSADYAPSVWKRGSGHCRECARAYEREWNAKNTERNSAATRRSRAVRLLRKYQAPIDDIDVLLAEQGGVCYLCGGSAGTKGFHIDHDHELHDMGLPSYRGLACHGCNVGVGALEDDPERLHRVADRLSARKAALRRVTT